MTTTPAPAVTVEQAQLALTLLNGPQSMAGMRALGVLLHRETPLTFEEYEQAYPPGSAEAQDLGAALGTCETLATFVKLGLLPRLLVDELLWVEGMWRALGPVALGMRRKSGEPRSYENFEALADGTMQPGAQ